MGQWNFNDEGTLKKPPKWSSQGSHYDPNDKNYAGG
jgi:hypothetical protein